MRSTRRNTRNSRRWSPNEGRFDVPRSSALAPRASRSGGRPAANQKGQGRLRAPATLGIGRTPVREALQRLAREGLVTILPRKGILVSDINPRNQLLVLEVRREIERLLSRTGAERATKEQRQQLLDIAQGMDRAAKNNDDIDFMRLDRELNRLIVEAAHNDYAARSMKLLQGLSRRFWYMHYREAADLPLCARLHANQARAIAQGDAEAAARASDKLLDYVENFTRGTVLA